MEPIIDETNNDLPNTVTNKGKKNTVDLIIDKGGNFRWSMALVEFMLDSIEDIIGKNGKKCDHGLTGGSYEKCAKHFVASNMGIDGRYPTAKNIKNKLRAMREQYMLRKDASSASGFGMGTDGRILADDIAWKAYVEAHPKAKDLRTSPFIYYDRVAQIYGNSSATGENAVTVEEEGYNRSETAQTDYLDFDLCDLDSQTISMPSQNQSNTNDAETSERPRRSRPHPVTEGEVNAPKKKRRSFSSVDDSLEKIAEEAKAVTELTRSLVEAQLRLVAAEYIPSIEDVAAKLRAMPNITRQETVKAIGMFAGNGAARSTFMTIMEEDREEWLMGFLHGN